MHRLFLEYQLDDDRKKTYLKASIYKWFYVLNRSHKRNKRVDLLGISRGAKDYLVGECKFKKAPFSYSEYLDTLAKLTPLKQKAKFYYALFSENGFDNKIVTAAEESA